MQLFSLFQTLLLVCRNVKVLHGSYPASLYGISLYRITSSANNLTSVFLIWKPFTLFSCLIALAMNSSTVLNRINAHGLRGRTFTFHHWAHCSLWVCSVCLIGWSTPPLYLTDWGFLIMKECGVLKNDFSVSTEMITWLLFSILLMWCINSIAARKKNYN